ncbi:MAG: VTT domain-containing protein [Pseudomonadota bacterium]
MSDSMVSHPSKTQGWKKYLPIAVIAIGAVAGFVFLKDYLSFTALEQNYQALTDWRDQNFLLTILAFSGAYILAVVFSIPGAIWLTLLGGFLFGMVLGSVIVVLSATLGATGLFLAARTSFGALLRSKAGGWVSQLEARFKEGEISFMLIMRLVPAVPFFIANLVPAFLGVSLFNFVWTTLVGIIPGTIVFISIGSGLGEQLSRGEAPDLGVIFEPHVLGPLLGLALLSALPLILKKLGVTKKT